MTKTQQKTVRLDLHPLWSISRPEDFDEEPQVLTMSLSAATWRSIVSWAELQGFRAPTGRFFAGQTAGLVAALKDALVALPDTPAPRRPGHVTRAWTLATYFRDKANAKVLQRVLDFASQGGSLTVSDN